VGTKRSRTSRDADPRVLSHVDAQLFVLVSLSERKRIIRHLGQVQTTLLTDGVAEGGAKPESTLVYSEVDEPVKKIATSLPVSDELLEDAESFAGYLNGRLSNFVQQEEERQLLRGAGTDELVGIVGRSGVNTLGTAAAGTIMAEHILKAATGSRGSAFVDPDTLVIHPTNWQTLRLAKDTTGQYLGGGPWTGSYGQPGQVSTGYFSSAPIWNLNVWVTTGVGLGTAVLGSFKQAASNSEKGWPLGRSQQQPQRLFCEKPKHG
jgi:Phage capsid family